MDLAKVAARLRARRFFVVLAAVIAVCVGLSALYTVGSSGLASKGQTYYLGSAQILVDSRPSTLTDLGVASSAQTLASRAPLYAEYATTKSVAAKIARLAGVDPQSLSVSAGTSIVTQPQSSNASSPSAAARRDSVVLSADGVTPVVSVTSEAGSTAVARRLVDATLHGLQQSVRQLRVAQHVNASGQVVLRPLGATQASSLRSAPTKSKAIEYGLGAFVALILVLLVVDNVILGRRSHQGVPSTHQDLESQQA